MQTDSELESDTSSINESIPPCNLLLNPQLSRDQLEKRIESLVQENRVLRCEIDTFKLRVKSLQEDNRELRKNSVNIQARAEQEEEYISNKLLKKIQSLKKEKETLANNYEREEEYLTNDLSRKLNQLKNEKVQLEQTLEQEQEHMVNKLMRKIERLEAETMSKQTNLEQLRREKIELENTLEQEQESLVNRLWKRMGRLETEKRLLQEKLDQPLSAPISPRNIQLTNNNNNKSSSSSVSGAQPISNSNNTSGYASSSSSSLSAANNINTTFQLSTNNNVGGGSDGGSTDTAVSLTEHIINLRREVAKLKMILDKTEREHQENAAKLLKEEKEIKEENLRLQRRLQMEVDRREALCRHLSESESSLEMDDERHFNETTRVRTISSPLPSDMLVNTNNQLNMSITQHTPAVAVGLTNLTTNAPVIENRCPLCNQCKPHIIPNSSPLKKPTTTLIKQNSNNLQPTQPNSSNMKL